jgi:hypothetical protein
MIRDFKLQVILRISFPQAPEYPTVLGPLQKNLLLNISANFRKNSNWTPLAQGPLGNGFMKITLKVLSSHLN